MIDHICTSHTDEDCVTCDAIQKKYEEILGTPCTFFGFTIHIDNGISPNGCLYHEKRQPCSDAHECPRVIDYFENMPTEE